MSKNIKNIAVNIYYGRRKLYGKLPRFVGLRALRRINRRANRFSKLFEEY